MYHASDYYQRINIEEICAHNLELFEALAAINPERAYQIQQAHTQNSPKISNIQNSSTQQSMPNIPEQPMFTWATPQEEQTKTAQDDPSEPSHSSSSHSSKNSCSTKSSSTKRKRGNNKKDKKKKNKDIPPTPVTPGVPNPLLMTPDEVDAALHELMRYDYWDNNAYLIMQLYIKDKNQMFIALTAHKNKLEKEKLSRVQTRLLDLAKKQNLTILQYDDNALTHLKSFQDE